VAQVSARPEGPRAEALSEAGRGRGREAEASKVARARPAPARRLIFLGLGAMAATFPTNRLRKRVWVGALTASRRTPQDALRRTKRPQLLGPGGPDDPEAQPCGTELATH